MSNATGTFIEPQQTAKKPRTLSFEAFYKKYAARADGFKYEWNDGFSAEAAVPYFSLTVDAIFKK